MKHGGFGKLLFVVLIGIYVVLLGALSLKYSPSVRAFPVIVIVPLLTLILAKIASLLSPRLSRWIDPPSQVVTYLEEVKSRTGVVTGQLGEEAAGTIWVMFGWIISLLPIMYLLVALPGMLVFCLVYLRLYAQSTWGVAVLYSVSLTLFLYLVIERFLNVQLFAGILIDLN